MSTSSTWPHSWTEDVRTPLWIFSGPGPGTSTSASTSTSSSTDAVDIKPIAFFMLSIPFWIELLALLVLEACFSVLVAVILYWFIARHQRQRHHKNHGCKYTSTYYYYLIGYGVFVAFWIVVPKPVVDALGITNKIFRFSLVVLTPTTAVFRTSAALQGCAPPHALDSLPEFLLYFCSPLTLMVSSSSVPAMTNDKKDKNTANSKTTTKHEKDDVKKRSYVRVTLLESLPHFLHFTFLMFATGGFLSMFYLLEEFPNFGGRTINNEDLVDVNKEDDWYRPSRIWNVHVWKDSLLYAILFQLFLTTFGEGLVLFTQLVTGLKAEPIMDNPIFASSSPSDFWGRRWNTLIHQCLKNGVYKPVMQSTRGRNKKKKLLAVTITFVASGLFHEWLLPAVFHDYPIAYGFNLLFFAYQGLLVALDSALAECKILVKLGQTIPAPLRTILVISLGIPMAHFFTDPYVRSDFFHHSTMAFPCFLPLHNTIIMDHTGS